MSERSTRGKGKKSSVAALEGLKAARENATKGVSALDAFELEEDEDVFETVDEATYADVVEKRRAAGDFVVDDGKCAY